MTTKLKPEIDLLALIVTVMNHQFVCFKVRLCLVGRMSETIIKQINIRQYSLNYLGGFGRRGSTVVSASNLESEGQELEPWRVHPRCILRQNT